MSLLPIIAGLTLGAGIAAAARGAGYDRDRSFYPTVLMVVASYYVLFAVMGGQALSVELAIATGFAGLAWLGGRGRLWLVGVGLLLHGLFDLLHPAVIDNSGVPAWWPAFCAAVDLVLGGWVLLMAGRVPRNGLPPH